MNLGEASGGEAPPVVVAEGNRVGGPRPLATGLGARATSEPTYVGNSGRVVLFRASSPGPTNVEGATQPDTGEALKGAVWRRVGRAGNHNDHTNLSTPGYGMQQ